MQQMYAQRYGTIPIVHATGGLKDSVEQYEPAAEGGESKGQVRVPVATHTRLLGISIRHTHAAFACAHMLHCPKPYMLRLLTPLTPQLGLEFASPVSFAHKGCAAQGHPHQPRARTTAAAWRAPPAHRVLLCLLLRVWWSERWCGVVWLWWCGCGCGCGCGCDQGWKFGNCDTNGLRWGLGRCFLP